MKNRKSIIILLIILSAIIVILFEFRKPIYYSVFSPYNYEFKPERYYDLFTDSAKSKINKTSCSGDVGKDDILYWYKIGQYKIIIWEFKNPGGICLNDIQFVTNAPVNYNEFDDFGGHPDYFPRPFIQYKWGYHLNAPISFHFDSNCKILSTKDSLNYKSFFAKISYLIIKSNNETQIVFDYKTTMINKINNSSKLHRPSNDELTSRLPIAVPTYLLLLNKQNSFYIILVNSEVPFDESVIKLFNL
jgi:hypothetical protein